MVKIIVAAIVAGTVAVGSAMQTTTSSWSGGTEFRFSFTKDECAQMAKSWSAADAFAHQVADALARDYDNAGGGILLGRVAAEMKVAADLYSMSKENIRNWGGPGSWTLVVDRRDGLLGALKLLDSVAGMWRKAAIKF